MIPLYTNFKIAEIDRVTIQNYTGSLELISGASILFVNWFLKKVEYIDNVHIMCGPGNNGADGYQIAIHLAQRGFAVHVFTIDIFSKHTHENGHLRALVERSSEIKHDFISSPDQLKNETGKFICIDAILGNGISRPVTGKLRSIMEKMQRVYPLIYAVDVPSGLLQSDQATSFALKATATIAFEFPKLAFFDPANESFTGTWDFGSIGLSREATEKLVPDAHLVEPSDVSGMLQSRPPFAHKGMMGKAVVMAGNDPMPGAIHLVTHACVSSGAGYTFLFDPGDTLNTIGDTIPEVIRKTSWNSLPLDSAKVVAMGSGLGVDRTAVEWVDRVLEECEMPLVLDADALNIIAENNWMNRIPEGAILTPHVREFERLFGDFRSHHERVREQQKRSLQHRIVLILKGRYTSITNHDGELYYNTSGNPGLAKAGSGDVLTGIITGLRSQGYDSFSAATIGVFIHGYCGDLALHNSHEKAINPSHLKNFLGKAFFNIQQLKDYYV